MKTLHIFWLLISIPVNLSAQEIRFVDTNELIPTAERFGIDSALHLASGFPIFQIDSITALELITHLSNYERYSINDNFFNNMAHNWENESIKEKTKKFVIGQLTQIENGQLNRYGRIQILDDRLIIGIIFQRPDSIEKYLIHAYTICSKRVDSLRKEFPSIIVRFFNSFQAYDIPVVAFHKDYQKNCYRIMWTLGQLHSRYFYHKHLSYHKSKLKKWEQDRDLMRFKVELNEYESKIINLVRPYNSIKEIDFQNEPELNSILRNYNGKDVCWKYLLFNNNEGFLDLGCSFGPLAGQGIEFRIELICKNKLKLTIIGAWIS